MEPLRHYLTFIYLILGLYLQSSKSEFLKLNISTFTHCIFNLVGFSDGQDYSTTDLIEEITVANRETLLWRIAEMLPGPLNETLKSPLKPLFLHEVCSINIMITVTACSDTSFNALFGPRVYNSKNMLFIIQ